MNVSVMALDFRNHVWNIRFGKWDSLVFLAILRECALGEIQTLHFSRIELNSIKFDAAKVQLLNHPSISAASSTGCVEIAREMRDVIVMSAVINSIMKRCTSMFITGWEWSVQTGFVNNTRVEYVRALNEMQAVQLYKSLINKMG